MVIYTVAVAANTTTQKAANDKQTSKTETGRNFQFNIRQGSAKSADSRAKKVSGEWVYTSLNVIQYVHVVVAAFAVVCDKVTGWRRRPLASEGCQRAFITKQWFLLDTQTLIPCACPFIYIYVHTLVYACVWHIYICRCIHSNAHNRLGSLWLLFLLMLPASSVNRLLKQVVAVRFAKAFLLTFVACVAEVLRFVWYCAQ